MKSADFARLRRANGAATRRQDQRMSVPWQAYCLFNSANPYDFAISGPINSRQSDVTVLIAAGS
jgi:hypothetical protein